MYSFRKLWGWLRLAPSTTDQTSVLGDLQANSTSNTVLLNNGTTSSSILTATHSAEGANRVQNKDLDASNVQFVDPNDTSKKANFSLSGATTGTELTLACDQTANITITLPGSSSDTVVTENATQTLTNKTLTSPVINGGIETSPTINTPVITGGTIADVSITDSNMTGSFTGNITTEDLTNFVIQNTSDNTKQAIFNVAPIPTGTTVTYEMPPANTILVGNDSTQTLTNKTIALGSNTVTAPGAYELIAGGTSSSSPLQQVSGTGSAGQVLTSNGAGSLPSWGSGIALKAPTISTAGTSLTGGFSGSTYTTPANVLYLKVRMVGGGGGGSGSDNNVLTTAQAGGAGGNTIFGTSLLEAFGGAATTANGGIAGAGGTVSVGAGATALVALQGGGGSDGGQAAAVATNTTSAFIGGPAGASSPFGGAGGGGNVDNRPGSGYNAIANSGSGGGGAGSPPAGGHQNFYGASGSAGGYIEAIIIPTALQTFSFSIGSSGSGGVGGPNEGEPGGNGGSGYIVVEEFYQ